VTQAVAHRSALDAGSGFLGYHLGISALGHLTAVVALAALWGLADREPPKRLIDPDSVIEVSVVSAPRKKAAAPTRTTRRAVQAPTRTQAPPKEQAPPPKQSEMVHKTDKAPPAATTEAPKETTRERSAKAPPDLTDLLSELQNADAGPVDRDAAGPEGTADAKPSTRAGASTGDPEFVAYVQKVSALLDGHFRPLEAVVRNNPGLETQAMLFVSDDGTITDYEVTQSSGNPSFDAAATRAIEAVGKLPLPPEKFRALMSEGYLVRFNRDA